MTPLRIAGIGVCAAGIPDWAAARSFLRGESRWQPAPLPKLDVPLLPATERRRTNAASRLAINVAAQAVAGIAPAELGMLASVFATGDGDGEVLAGTLRALADDPTAMSPTLFHNSVLNAPAGYWSIAVGARAPSTTVCAGAGTFAAGLLEASIQVITQDKPVLLVASDLPFPPVLASFGITGEAFGCAILLAPQGDDRQTKYGTLATTFAPRVAHAGATAIPAELAAHFAGNPAAEALPLLACIARDAPLAASLRYLHDACVDVDYRP